MSAREIVADAITEAWSTDDWSVPFMSDRILSALSEAGYRVERLEEAGWRRYEGETVIPGWMYREEWPVADDWPPAYDDWEPLYRIASPVAPPVSREAQ